MGNYHDIEPYEDGEFFDEEFNQDPEQDESVINWRLIGTAILSTILIISIILGLIGPALIRLDFPSTLPAATPTLYPNLIGFGF
jgi:hypothetical protein